ncbi:PREDICTED: UPF0729 protein AGAP000931 [Nicrophorus vespilloides]|uniref:UPF0729 protein AGAP000931 n=1 Tax=Nicrophorus vespilloides TaxID=110193 RepID=A0ABM1NJI3_NICVS|nr:PREDICTED: UPF0729 protein AGAP000931 [Nicrophorus vespilloides]
MAGCVPCFIIPLLLFIFHRYIQPIILKFWNPWETKVDEEELKKPFNCTSCKYDKNGANSCKPDITESETTTTANSAKLKCN